jgi:SAM-dependent methyltransferase
MTVATRNQTNQAQTTPVIDYEGSHYQTDFWDGRGREYEDATERLALQKLAPAYGGRIVEIGAGFGRLGELYLGYEQIVLFDYSRTLLQEAVRRWGNDPRFIFVAGNVYTLPFASGIFDTLVMVRVMHHLADVPQALRQLQRVLHRQSIGVLEYANKRNLKALLRWILGRQSWSPFALKPLEFVPLNFDFHPTWMADQVAGANLYIRQQCGVSHFRLPFFKAWFSTKTLAQLDQWLYKLGGHYPVAPSVFMQVCPTGAVVRPAIGTEAAALAQLFRCPYCMAERLELVAIGQLLCNGCGKIYRQNQRIWDFKEPTEGITT